MSRVKVMATLVASALLWPCAESASAAPVGAPSALHPNSTVIDFEGFPVGTAEPITVGGVTISTYLREGNNNPRTVVARRPHQTEHPGIFEGNFFGEGRHHFLIEFDSPVSQVGMGIFDPNFDGNEVRVFDSAGNLLEEVASAAGDAIFPTGPVGGTHSTFVGFVRPTADIAFVELHNVFDPASNVTDLLGIDNVTFFGGGGTAGVPEPSTLALLSVVGCLAGFFAWRKRGTRVA